MSQYPSPYQSPYQAGYMYQQAHPNLLGPAHRSGILMGVMGALMLLTGVCCVGFSNFDFSKLPPESKAQLEQAEAQLAHVNMTLSGVLMGMGAVSGGGGLLMVLLAIFVYRGGLGAVVTALILTVLFALMMAFLAVSTVIQAGRSGQPTQMAGVCVYVLPLVLFLLLMYWLIQAAKRAPHITAAKAQQQAQMWQYQQAQQTYGQPGGYAYPPQPPPPQQNLRSPLDPDPPKPPHGTPPAQ